MQIQQHQEQHPLAVTLARIASIAGSPAEVGTLEADWFLASALYEPDSSRLTQALARQAVSYPQMDVRTQAAYFINQYSWYLPATAITAYLTEQRVPDLVPTNVALRIVRYTWHHEGKSGEAEQLHIRFLGGSFACLPDDPAANHPDAVILPDQKALRDWLRTTLEAHFSPLIGQVATLTRLGRNAQWRLVADSCALLFLYAGRALNAELFGISEGHTLIQAPHSPLANPQTGYITLSCEGQTDTFRTRGGCCRYYTVSEVGEKCSTCVLHKPEDRDRLLLQYLSQRVPKETTV